MTYALHVPHQSAACPTNMKSYRGQFHVMHTGFDSVNICVCLSPPFCWTSCTIDRVHNSGHACFTLSPLSL
jgi:hypothetical protein